MDGLSVETLELIQNTAVKAAAAESKLAIVKPAAEPAHVYLTVKPDGSFDKHEAARAPANHRLITIDEVARFITDKGTESTVVWYDRIGVQIVIDDATRRDFATMSLKLTPQIDLLTRLEKDRTGYDQRGFRRLLRVDLDGCRRDDRLLNWVSELKWARLEGSKGSVALDRESLGHEINAEAVSGAGECPEETVLDVRIFDDPSLQERHPIRCAFEPPLSEQLFRLIPLPLQIHDAIELEVAFIGEKLRGLTDASCFRGRFSA